MAQDGDGDEPTKLPLRPRTPRQLASVPGPIARDAQAQLDAQRGAFTRTYLGVLQEPDTVEHVRQILQHGEAKDVAAILLPLTRVLFPSEEKRSGPVQVNLVHGVPRPPIDVTP
jgi:hypothetical protein